MTSDDYLKRSHAINERARIVREQIGEHVRVYGDTKNSVVWPLVDRHQEILKELADLDREYLGNA